MSNLGSLNKQKIHSTHTTSTHGANFFQKRFNQLPSLFSNNMSERDEDEYTSPPAPPPPLASTSSTTKKEKFRIRNFLSVSTSSQNSSQENNDGRSQKKITHQSSLNSTLTSKSTIQVIIGEPKKLAKSRLKECLNQKNVRRKSSSINTGCVNFANSCNKLSNSNTFKRQHLDVNLIEKAARRGSIHFYDKKKKNSNDELDDFRQRLLKLQRLQLEFLKANPLLSSNGTYRRKRAFVINEDFDNDDQNFRILPRLSHAISSLVSYY
ncbi:unnamed protein product [Brachionus calyciflorus]|uniref:Uncharacterized protein n=1 Tax=Brachionus calyciflorus TaxID=104777 RepID=A0A813Q1U0_9BILA|nr:unnamed protein product [Brachionus calyciflorus]